MSISNNLARRQQIHLDLLLRKQLTGDLNADLTAS
jgi:hypothetical protein